MGWLFAPFIFIFSLIGGAFTAIGFLIALVLSCVGRLIGFIVGAVLATLGVGLSLTGIGLIIGVPLTLFGGALALKAIF